MHIFLTGDVQVGKSTVIRKALTGLSVPVGGFRTGYGSRRGDADRWLYLWDAGEPPVQDEARGVVHFTERRPEVFPERFNTLGCSALHRARQSGAKLILMDECGRFEEQALEFQSEIFAALNGSIPVLGVIRQGYHGWLDKLRSQPGISLLTVTTENRDELPGQITQILQKSI